MNDVLKYGKKLFTASVVGVTVAWSMGLAALVPSVAFAQTTECDSLEAGDLFKVPGSSAVYYLTADMKKAYFPNDDIFRSWNLSFSQVQTISGSCLNSYLSANPAGINYRPGSRLVKVEGSPDVFAILPGNNLVKVTGESVAALYGANWGSALRDVSPYHFPNYTNTQTTWGEAKPHDGQFVKKAGETTVYWVKDGMLHRVDGTNVPDVREVSATTFGMLSVASGSVTLSTAFENPAQASGSVVVPTSGTVTVSLAGNTPASASVPKDGVRVPFTRVTLTAGDRAAVVDTVTVRRTGLSDYSDFSRVWAEKDGLRVSSQQTIASNDLATLTFSPALTVGAGQTVTLEIVASLSNATGNAALAVAGATTSGNVQANGSFPVTGNVMHFTDYTVAEYDFSTSSNRTVNVGDSEVELTSFELTPDKDVLFRSITLRNNGEEDLQKAVSGLYLEANGEKVSQSVSLDGRYVTFNLTNGGFLIEDGDATNFLVKGDVMLKERTGTESLAFAFHRAEDISLVEKSTGFGAKVDSSVPAFPVELNDVEFVSGAVTVSKKTTSPADTEVLKGAKGVVALRANVKADESVMAEGLKLTGTGDYASFENVKVTLNGISLGTEAPGATMTFDSSFTLNKGDNELIVTVDVKSNATSTEDFKVSVNSATFLAGMVPEYVQSGNSVDSSDIVGSPVGALLTVQGADVTVARNDGYTNTRTLVRGTQGNVLARFNVRPLYDNVTITSIAITPSTTASQISSSAVSNVRLSVGGTQVGPTRAYSSATFSSLNYAIAKDATRSFEVHADLDSSSTGTLAFNFVVTYRDSLGKTSSTVAQKSALNTVVESGSVSIAVDASSPEATIILAGTEQTVGAYRLSAVREGVSFTELTFTNASGVDSRVAEYRLYKGGSVIATANPIAGETKFTLGTNALSVGANQAETITVKAMLNPITDRDSTSSTLQLTLDAAKYRATSGETVTTSSLGYAAQAMVVRKTVPTFAKVALTETGAGSANEEVFKFAVSAGANEDVKLTKLVFDLTGTGAASTSAFVLYEGDTIRGASSSTPDWYSLDITVAKGTTKTFTVKANTSNVAVDKRVVVGLSRGTAGANIAWEEVFIDGGNIAADGDYLNTLPLSQTKNY